MVVNITGAKCWQGLEGKYLHCIKMGRHRIQLSFTTPKKDMLEKALDWDYYEEMEPMVNRTSSQAGQFPFIDVSMDTDYVAEEGSRREKTHVEDDLKDLNEEEQMKDVGEVSCDNGEGDTAGC